MPIEKKREAIITVLFWAMILLLVYIGIKYLVLWFLPFIIGFGVSYALRRPIAWLHQKTRLPAKMLSVLLVAFLAGGACLLSWQIISHIVLGVGSLAEQLPELSGDALPEAAENINRTLFAIAGKMPGDSHENFTLISDSANAAVQNLISGAAGSAGKWVSGVLAFLPGFLITFVITVAACCFISMDVGRITGFVRRQLSDRHNNTLTRIKTVFTEGIFKMLRAYGLIMLITFGELAVGLALLRVEYAVALAAVIAMVDILPVLGSGTVLIPWGVINLVLGNLPLGVGLLVLYLIIMVLRNFLEPRIVGGQMGLPPVASLVAIYLGLRIFGVVGMFLLPLFFMVIKGLQESGHIRLWKQ